MADAFQTIEMNGRTYVVWASGSVSSVYYRKGISYPYYRRVGEKVAAKVRSKLPA